MRQVVMNRRALKILSVVSSLTWLTIAAPSAFADHNDHPGGPISSNPDDYDVPKYQRIFEDARRRHGAAHERLEQAAAHVREVEAKLAAESRKLEQARAQVETARTAMEGAQARIQQLQAANQSAQTEITRINQTDLPAAQRAVTAEEQRNATIRTQLQSAEADLARLNREAEQEEQEARTLDTNADQKEAAATELQAQLTPLNTRLQAAEAERTGVQTKLDERRLRLRTIDGELQTLRNARPALERDLTTRRQTSDEAERTAREAEEKARVAEANGDPNAPRLRREAHEARRFANHALRVTQQAQQALDVNARRTTELDGERVTVGQEIQTLEAKHAELSNQIVSLRQEVAALQPRVQAAQADARQARQIANGAAADAQRARAAANQKQQIVTALRGELAESERKLTELRVRPDQLRARVVALQQQTTANNAEIIRQQQALSTAVAQMQAASANFRRQQDIVRAIEADLSRDIVARDAAARAAEVAHQDMLAAQTRLAQVQTNLSNGIAIAQADGRADGSRDGAVEGARAGAENGSREGNDVGEREGRAAGTAEGVARAQGRGRSEGSAVGATEGRQQGNDAGVRRGREEGARDGRAQGLQAGYDAGRREGDAQGYRDGISSNVGYDAGRREGVAAGTQRATQEGTTRGRADGYRLIEEQYLEADLADVTIPNRTAPPAAGVFEHPDWQGFNPNRRYPHPAIQEAYVVSYRETFMATAAQVYDRVYGETFARVRAQVFESVRREYAGREYPNEYRAAYDSAREQARQQAFTQAEREAFTREYEPARRAAYDLALPTRREEGLTAGRSEGRVRAEGENRARGRAEGDRDSYNTTYPVVYERSKREGEQEAHRFYSSNAVLKSDGGLLADANGDGVFAPGEEVTVTLAVKNFGKVPQSTDVQIGLDSGTPGLVIERPTDVLARIPGQTRAVVTGIGKMRVLQQTEAGSRQSVRLSARYNGADLGSTTLTLNVSFPYAVAAIDVQDYVMPNQDNRVAVQVRNVTSRASEADVSVRLVSLDGLASIVGAQAQLGRVAAGETKRGDVAFSFTDANAFKTLNFEVQVFEGTWLLGKRRFAVDSSKRWVFNPNSAGLFVVGDSAVAKRAEDAGRIAGLAYDLWDVRVEGELTSEAALRYVDKTIVVPSTGGLADATARAVKDVLDRGGRAYGGVAPGSDRTAVGALLAQYARAVKSTAFHNLTVAQGNFFRRTDPRYQISFGQDLRGNDTAAQLADRLVTFDLISGTILEKISGYLAALPTGNAVRTTRARDAILRDLVKEMQDDKEVDGSNFKSNRANLLLTAFINTALSKTGTERRALLSFYPPLEEARKDIGWLLSSRRAHIKKVLKPLKEAYKRELKD